MNDKNLKTATVAPQDLNGAHGGNEMNVNAEQRLSPRMATNSSVGLPGGRSGTIVNISESGICFEYDGSELKGDILLSTDLLPSKNGQNTEIPAKIVWCASSAGRGVRCGARLVLSDKNYHTQLREIIFDDFAKKASADMDKDLKMKVENFFNKEVRQFHEDLTALDKKISEGNIESEEAEKEITTLINELLLKGHSLEKAVNDERCMKKIKQLLEGI